MLKENIMPLNLPIIQRLNFVNLLKTSKKSIQMKKLNGSYKKAQKTQKKFKTELLTMLKYL